MRSWERAGIGKRFVYILRSDSDPVRHYVGVTSNPDERLHRHNEGPSGHIVDHRPWSFVVVIEFPTERNALRFERYLKSGSGRAFSKRHFASLNPKTIRTGRIEVPKASPGADKLA